MPLIDENELKFKREIHLIRFELQIEEKSDYVLTARMHHRKVKATAFTKARQLKELRLSI